jgi:hypothetical protein
MTELEQLEQFHAELCADIGGNCVTGDRTREQLAAEIAAEEEAGLA